MSFIFSYFRLWQRFQNTRCSLTLIIAISGINSIQCIIQQIYIITNMAIILLKTISCFCQHCIINASIPITITTKSCSIIVILVIYAISQAAGIHKFIHIAIVGAILVQAFL